MSRCGANVRGREPPSSIRAKDECSLVQFQNVLSSTAGYILLTRARRCESLAAAVDPAEAL